MIVTAHAATAYVERIAPHLSIEEARAAIAASERVIMTAARFGCFTILTGAGAKLTIGEGEDGGVAVVDVTWAKARQMPVPAKIIARWGKAKRGRVVA